MEEGKGMKRVVVFGIFDEVHEGHRFLFEQAKTYGAELVVVVGRDDFVRTFKNKEPKNSEKSRVEMIQKESLVDMVVLGDEVSSSYQVLSTLRPDVICLGYDQDVLEEDLKRWMAGQGLSIPIVRALYKNPIGKV
ncbi:MAG: adenylyltransferase/cytidyltransferase family protein [bacterium]|nr:adenylyltransferase/cytidyltransferase family protein [bacterium]